MANINKGLGTKEQNAIRDEFYQKLTTFLEMEGLSGTRVDEGIVVGLEKADITVKVIVKKERVDIEGKLADLAKKEELRKEAEALKNKKKLADEAKRAKAEAQKLAAQEPVAATGNQ